MIEYSINEVYDGRLPQYEVVEASVENKSEYIVLKTFDNQQDAEEYIKSLTE
jgi:hypothetical protein